MKTVVIGLGIQGNKRAAIAGADLVATVDPVNAAARFKEIREVPLDSFSSALVCTPDQTKFEIIEYLLCNGKNVLVEKPLLASDNVPIHRLLTLAVQNKAVCYTAYNHRFEPHIVNLKRTLDSGKLGSVYSVRFFYGNGTARDIKLSAWRDQGMGVLPDLGSHLLDMALFLFGEKVMNRSFKPWSFNRFENKSFDHVIFGSEPDSENRELFVFEASVLSWCNTFSLDVFAENGSAHISCLCKWGPSTLTVRKRVLPSGRPDEESQVIKCSDPTWALEYEHFKSLCKSGNTNLKNDLWINASLGQLSILTEVKK